jgi:hypothetical protein
MAEAMSSVAVESHEYFTLELMLLVTEPDMLSLMQAHDARACGPLGQ